MAAPRKLDGRGGPDPGAGTGDHRDGS
jgi:hypothetical protein